MLKQIDWLTEFALFEHRGDVSLLSDCWHRHRHCHNCRPKHPIRRGKMQHVSFSRTDQIASHIDSNRIVAGREHFVTI
jgi:hypothetical protein